MTLESLARRDTPADLVAIEIKMELAKRGQSQAALARALEEPPMWVSARLSGTVQMTVNDFARIADALGLGMRDLLPEPDERLRKRRLSEAARVGVPITIPRQAVRRSPLAAAYPSGGRPPTYPVGHGPPSGPRRTARTGR